MDVDFFDDIGAAGTDKEVPLVNVGAVFLWWDEAVAVADVER